MNLDFQVLAASDLNEIFIFADDRLKTAIKDENERMLHSWHVKWRKEALELYLRLGWSFVAREAGVTKGFYLAQPLLFFRGQTQTLWVEHIEADPSVAEALIDVAVRVAREKHLQRVLIANADSLKAGLDRWHAQRLNDDIAEVRTTKG